jgi:16S rRNA G966 N2-methylase RsmD
MLAGRTDRRFEYIYIAPPQYKGMWLEALKLLDDHLDWLSGDGTVIVQIDPSEYEEVKLHNFAEGEQRKYGRTMLIFYDRL